MVDYEIDPDQKARELHKKRRRRYWRARAALEESNPEDEDREKFEVHYHSTVSTWLLYVAAAFESVAENRPSYEEVWYERDIAGYDGLESVLEEGFGEPGEMQLSIEELHEVGELIDRFTVKAFDFPDQQPVVEDPWSPDEMRSFEEFLEDVPGDLEEEIVGGDIQ